MPLSDLLTPAPWAIAPEAMESLCTAYNQLAAGALSDPAKAALPGSRNDGDLNYNLKGKVALVECGGVIHRRAGHSLCFAWDGQDRIRAAIDQAMADPEARALLLSFDSPGGVAAGVKELADHIAAQSGKPIYAYADGLCASAAYWLANTTATALGADREGDEAYRRRIHLAPEHFSVAGPEGAYRYHTLAVHQDIADCSVWRPKPGTVDVRPIMKGGQLPPEDILAAIRNRLNDKRIRPLTDTVIVAAPEPVAYAIAGGWYLHREYEALAESVKHRVAEAVEEYRLWQRGLPGRDINDTKLVALMERAGAKRVELASPVFQKLDPWQLALETEVSIEFSGLEDD